MVISFHKHKSYAFYICTQHIILRKLMAIKIIQNGRPDTNGCPDTSTYEDIIPQKSKYTQQFTYFTFNTLKQAQICIERPANEKYKN